jgi:16S rRNA (cytidine1402-2'-O)-methyltransferase
MTSADGSSSRHSAGALVLVATPIGNLGDLSPRAIAALRDADEIWCEDTRRTRALLTHCGISGARMKSVQAHNEATAAASLVALVAGGRTIAYASDAGMPGVSDPGARLVAACADADLPVTVVPGPSAAISALVVSGLPSDRFVFEGFLARKGPERRAALERVARSDATSIVFEASNRVAATVADLARECGDDRSAAIVRELTKIYEEVIRGSLDELSGATTQGATIRGECVIVIGPAAPAADATDAAVDVALRDEMTRGSSARDAAATVAVALGIAKRRAYERAVALKAGG